MIFTSYTDVQFGLQRQGNKISSLWYAFSENMNHGLRGNQSTDYSLKDALRWQLAQYLATWSQRADSFRKMNNRKIGKQKEKFSGIWQLDSIATRWTFDNSGGNEANGVCCSALLSYGPTTRILKYWQFSLTYLELLNKKAVIFKVFSSLHK